MPHTNFINNLATTTSTSSNSTATTLDNTHDSSLVTANTRVYSRQSSIQNRKSNINNNNNNNNSNNNVKMLMVKKCEGCGEFISDLYHLVIASKFYWHLACLKCNLCGCILKNKCFIKNGKFYCSEDYFRLSDNQYLSNANKSNNQSNQTCKGCFKTLNSNDYVIRLNENYLYHLNCFKCNKCLINIKPGQKYGFLNDNLYCDKHYINGLANNIKCEPKNYLNEDCNSDYDASNKINDEIDLKPLLLLSSKSSTNNNNNNNYNDNEFYYLALNSGSNSTSSSSSSFTNSSSSNSMSPNEDNPASSMPLKFDFNINSDQQHDLSDNKSQNTSENENENTKTNQMDSYSIQDLTLNQIKTKLKQRCLSETTANIPHNYSSTIKSTSSVSIISPTENGVTMMTSIQITPSTASTSTVPHADLSSPKSSNKQAIRNMYSDKWSLTSGIQFNSIQKKKRMRTSFKHQQLRIMKAYFQLNQNPDSKELKDLSDRTSLSKRTLQVWFQNSRAKQRKTTNQLNTTIQTIASPIEFMNTNRTTTTTTTSTASNNQQQITSSTQLQNCNLRIKNLNFGCNYDKNEDNDDDDDDVDNDDSEHSSHNDSNSDENNENLVNDINNNDNAKLDTLSINSICLYNGTGSIDGDKNMMITTTMKDNLYFY